MRAGILSLATCKRILYGACAGVCLAGAGPGMSVLAAAITAVSLAVLLRLLADAAGLGPVPRSWLLAQLLATCVVVLLGGEVFPRGDEPKVLPVALPEASR